MTRSTKLAVMRLLLLGLVISAAGCASSNKMPDKQGTSPKDTVVPSPPENLIAKARGSAEIDISWESARDASSYNIYWSKRPNVTPQSGEKISRILKLHTTHSDLEAKTTYYYIVTAVGPGGQSSTSEEASATTEP